MRKASYLNIDHRSSPGVDAELIKKINAETGKNFPIVPEGANFEADTWMCVHCGTPVLPDASRVRGYCRKCDGYLCYKAECHQHCTPFKKVMDEAHDKIIPHLLDEGKHETVAKNLTIDMLRKTILSS